MPRLGVNALRWLLLASNVGVLTGLGFLGWDLFMPGADKQLHIALPEPDAVKVPMQAHSNFNPRDLNQIIRVHKDKPVVRSEPRIQEPELPSIQSEGPLQGWEITMTLRSKSRGFASIAEKVVQNVVTPGRTGAQGRPPTRNTRSRGPSSRTRQTRTPTRRTAVANASRTKFFGEGEDFSIDGNLYLARRISSSPRELEYEELENVTERPTGRRYTLTGDLPEWLGYEPNERGGILIRGLLDDELDIDPTRVGQAPPAEAVVNADERGEVRRTSEQPRRAPAPPTNRDQKKEDVENAKREIEKMKGMSDDERKAVKDALQPRPGTKESPAGARGGSR